MRIVIQRVKQATLEISGKRVSAIERGMVVLVGVCPEDTQEDIVWLCNKLVNLRIFSDEQDKMNLSINDVNGEILLVSQFTLYASTKKGNRPSYTGSASPDIAIPLYNEFIEALKESLGFRVKTGVFGENMQVALVNDGPVTIIIDSRDRQ